MTLSFHFLNVGHGSSTIVELSNSDQKLFGLVDSNASGNNEPRALTKLRDLGAKKLSFVALTHPHADHYSGLARVLTHFSSAIDSLFLFPILDLLRNRKRINEYYQILLTLDGSLEPGPIKSGNRELLQILRWADEHQDIVQPCEGNKNQLAAAGFEPVQIYSILPPSEAKGPYFDLIRKGDPSIEGSFVANEVSLALEFSYAGRTVILGGDGTKRNWSRRRTRFETRSGVEILADAVCLPHHGSITDCTDDVLSQLFVSAKKGNPRYGISSGDGRRHPAAEVIAWLKANDIAPYCTNLIPACGANAARLQNEPGLSPELSRWVREVSFDTHVSQACQGDITLSISADGKCSINTETGRPCPFRGDYDFISDLTSRH